MFFLSRRMTQIVTCKRLISTSATSYEDAIRTLNTLQTNAAYLQTAATNHSVGSTSLHALKKYLLRSGLTLEDVDKLSVIHVAGTKGKGSTCAFTESILRNYGFRTGFYSSPHLIHVAERIRINGRPIKEDLFSKYFWHVYDKLNSQKENELDMPTYFKFLTVLMFHIFLKSDIDVAILEVGIGGEYDCTNIVRNPVCVGITSLGLEHTALLGNTLEEIAYQKSGIFKENTIAFTVPQPENAMNVIRQRAVERKCSLHIVPDFISYNWINGPPILGIATKIQEENASLAIQLAHTWMTKISETNAALSDDKIITNLQLHTKEDNHKTESSCIDFGKIDDKIISSKQNATFVGKFQYNGNTHDTSGNSESEIPLNMNLVKRETSTISFARTASALASCTWPGRAQILRGREMDFYLDGAHTFESMKVCAAWYVSQVKNELQNRYLIFNVTGNRDVTLLLKPLKHLEFERVYFVPNVSIKTLKLDQLELKTTNAQQLEKCRKNLDIWDDKNAVVLDNVSEALAHISEQINSTKNTERKKIRPQVLFTGSLHLIGAALLLLDPKLTMITNY